MREIEPTGTMTPPVTGGSIEIRNGATSVVEGSVVLAVDRSGVALHAKKSRYPSKPLITLDGIAVNPLDTQWQKRAEEIDLKIKEGNQHTEKEVLIGKSGEPVIRVRGRRRKRFSLVYSVVPSNVGYPWERIKNQETRDEHKVIQKFVEQGATVCKLLGGYEIFLLNSLLGRVGEEGKVFYVTSAPNLRDQLFYNFSAASVDLLNVKGLKLIRKDKDKEDRSRFSIFNKLADQYSLLRSMQKFLTLPYSEDLSFYEGCYNRSDNRELAEAFYYRFPVIPIAANIPPLPLEIGEQSLDSVFELDRLSHIPDDKIQRFLGEIDRAVKPGGTVLFRENGVEQAKIEYYGQELFRRPYQRLTLHGLAHPDRWMALRKRDRSFVPVLKDIFDSHAGKPRRDDVTPTTEMNGMTSELIPFCKLVDSALKKVSERNITRFLSGKSTRPGELDLSVTWFRKNGLLSQLMSEFNGDIRKAVQFVVDTYQPNIQPFVDTKKVPVDTKTNYSIADIATEVGVDESEVRRVLEMEGINRLKGPKRSMGRKEKSVFSYAEYRVIKSIVVNNQRRRPKEI